MKTLVADPFTPVIAPPATSGITTRPTFERAAGEYVMRWTEPPVTMTFFNVREGSEGVYGELVITHGPEEIHWGRLSLASTSARETLVKKLQVMVESPPWRVMLERACRTTAHEARLVLPRFDGHLG